MACVETAAGDGDGYGYGGSGGNSTNGASSDPLFGDVPAEPERAYKQTIAFAQRLEAAGASLIAVHGRRRGREDRRRDGSADLRAIKAVVSSVSCPVLTNGNVMDIDDVHHNLELTKAAGVMAAEELLRDFALFARPECAMKTVQLADLCVFTFFFEKGV